jgi:hypothetical protein
MHWKGISCRAGLDNNGRDLSVQSHHGKPPPNISKGVVTCKASSRSKRIVKFFRQMLGMIDRQQETPSGMVCLANRKRCQLPSCVTLASAMDASVTINEMNRFVRLILIRTVDCLPKWRGGELLPFDLIGWRPWIGQALGTPRISSSSKEGWLLHLEPHPQACTCASFYTRI